MEVRRRRQGHQNLDKDVLTVGKELQKLVSHGSTALVLSSS